MQIPVPFIPGQRVSQETRGLIDALIIWARILNGQLELGTGTDKAPGAHIEGQFRVVTTHATPDTEFTVAHDLGRAVVGYFVIRLDKAGVVYDSGTAWTTSNIYLKCNVASVACTLFLL